MIEFESRVNRDILSASVYLYKEYKEIKGHQIFIQTLPPPTPNSTLHFAIEIEDDKYDVLKYTPNNLTSGKLNYDEIDQELTDYILSSDAFRQQARP